MCLRSQVGASRVRRNATRRARAFDNVPMTVRRLKTYTGAQGYVYQYYFVGKREALADDPEAPAVEYVFDVTTDRKTVFAVSVFLPPTAVASWEALRERPLSEPEQYAAIKQRLLQAFD